MISDSLLDPPPKAVWFDQFAVEMLELPSSLREMPRLCRQLSRAVQTEGARALLGRRLSHRTERTSVNLLCMSGDRVVGHVSHTDLLGRLHEQELKRVRIGSDGAIWVVEAQPPMSGWMLDATDQALNRWLIAALGQELYERIVAASTYGEVVATLAAHLASPERHVDRDRTRDLRAEGLQRGAALGARLFFTAATDRRDVAVAMADGWRGTIAELLDSVDAVLAQRPTIES